MRSDMVDDDVSEKTTVYFDQKVWGTLTEDREDIDVNEFYQITKRSAEELDYIYPFSIENLVESSSHPDSNFTSQVYTLMMELSKNYTIRNMESVLDYEAINYVCKHHPLLLELDMNSVVIGRGLLNLGGDWTLQPEELVDDYMLKEFKKILDDQDVNRQILLSEMMVEDAPGVTDEEKERYTRQYREKLEEMDTDLDFNDDTDRSLFITDIFEYRMLDRLREVCEGLGSSLEGLILETVNPNSFEGFYRQFPTFYTYANLSFSTEAHRNRKPEFNDILDMTSLSTAAPYCDIIVAEKFYSGMLYRHRIPEIYNTRVFDTVLKFAQYLREELH